MINLNFSMSFNDCALEVGLLFLFPLLEASVTVLNSRSRSETSMRGSLNRFPVAGLTILRHIPPYVTGLFITVVVECKEGGALSVATSKRSEKERKTMKLISQYSPTIHRLLAHCIEKSNRII